MSIQKEPVSFNFDYRSQQSKKKPKTIFRSFFSILYTTAMLVTCVMFIKYAFLVEGPKTSDFIYAEKDVAEFSQQLTEDFEEELNGSMPNLAHTRYNYWAFEDVQKLTSEFKKENKNIKFFPEQLTVKKEIFNIKKQFAEYTVTIPYVEKVSDVQYYAKLAYMEQGFSVNDSVEKSYIAKNIPPGIENIPDRKKENLVTKTLTYKILQDKYTLTATKVFLEEAKKAEGK